MVPFATPADLGDKFGITIASDDPKALRALADASALIRAYTGQQITAVSDETVDLRGVWSERLRLPQRPVTDVSAISVRFWRTFIFTPVSSGSYTWDRMGLLVLPYWWWGGDEAVVRVTYSHGYDTVPDDVEAVCLQIAARLYQSPLAGALASERRHLQNYEHDVTYAMPRRPGLAADELATLDRYKALAFSDV